MIDTRPGVRQVFHAVGEEFFFFLKKTLRVSPAYSKEHGRDRDKEVAIREHETRLFTPHGGGRVWLGASAAPVLMLLRAPRAPAG